MEHIGEIAVFAGKVAIIGGLLVLITILIANLAVRLKQTREQLEVEDLNDKFRSFGEAIGQSHLEPKEFKAELKRQRKLLKAERKAGKERRRVFVVDFQGDIRALAVENLRDEITAILTSAQPERDEVVVLVESTGGVVYGYGLAAAQLLRLRERKIKVTVCVDRVAASGGYMMACTADQILAAPFAILGSIGVVAQVPNFHRILKKHDIDYEEVTAGEFKRTVSLLGEITDKGRRKFLDQIEDTHQLFKEFVHHCRPSLDLNKVATGEYWFGHRALDLGLVDKLQSSDDYLFSLKDEARLLKIRVFTKKSIGERLAENFSLVIDRVMSRWLQRLESDRLV